MLRTMPCVRRFMLAVTATAMMACGDDNPTEPAALAGSYRATTFRVTPTGQPTADILVQGGSLSITIADNGSTTGSLVVPATLGGGPALNASMAGTVVRSGNSVQFQQSADTFVRDLTFTVNGSTLQATDQQAGGARFTVTLTRQ